MISSRRDSRRIMSIWKMLGIFGMSFFMSTFLPVGLSCHFSNSTKTAGSSHSREELKMPLR